MLYVPSSTPPLGALKRAQYHKDKAPFKLSMRKYYEANTDKFLAKALKRKAIKRGATGYDYTTAALIKARWDYYAGKCWI